MGKYLTLTEEGRALCLLHGINPDEEAENLDGGFLMALELKKMAKEIIEKKEQKAIPVPEVSEYNRKLVEEIKKEMEG